VNKRKKEEIYFNRINKKGGAISNLILKNYIKVEKNYISLHAVKDKIFYNKSVKINRRMV